MAESSRNNNQENSKIKFKENDIKIKEEKKIVYYHSKNIQKLQAQSAANPLSCLENKKNYNNLKSLQQKGDFQTLKNQNRSDQNSKTDLKKYLKILQLDEEQAKDFNNLRVRFRQKIIKYSQYKDQIDNDSKRQERGKILLAFHQLSNQIFKTTYCREQAEFLEAFFRGKTEKVKQMIDKNPQILLFRSKGNNYPLLYIASMTGHLDLVEMIIKTGPSLNFQKDNSTPLHAAAWYNHYYVAKLLLSYGIPHFIKNVHGETPIQNAECQLYELLQKPAKDKFLGLINSIIDKKLCKTVINVENKGEKIIRKIILKDYDKNFDKYVDAYHGTKFQKMESIAINGLKKPGSKVGDRVIEINKDNIREGVEFNGDKDWARNIFVSPSIHYAAQYSAFEYFKDEKSGRQKGWKSVVQVKVRKGCYKTFGDTLGGHERVENEPEELEYQINDQENVCVVALMLIKRDWLGHFETQRHHQYNDTSVIILNSEEQKKVKNYFQKINIPAPQG